MNVASIADREDDPISEAAIAVRGMLRQAAIAVDTFHSRCRRGENEPDHTGTGKPRGGSLVEDRYLWSEDAERILEAGKKSQCSWRKNDG